MESRFEEPAEPLTLAQPHSLVAAPVSETTGPPEIDALLDLLKRESRRRSPLLRKQFVIAAGATALFTSIVVTFGLSPVSPEVLYAQVPLLGSVLIGAVISGSEAQKRAARKLTEVDDVRAIGPLLEARYWPYPRIQKAATVALVQLLHKLTASDAALLTDAQRIYLYRSLKSEDPLFVRSALRAIAQIGDAAAFPYVERLMARTERKDHALFERAFHCRNALRVRLQREEVGHDLLRAAAPPDDPALALLRPAANQTGTDPAVLLRPRSPEQPDVS